MAVKALTIVLILFAAAVLVVPAMATTVWNANGTGGWTSPSQWSNGVPSDSNPAKFENVTLTFTDADIANLNSAKLVPADDATLIFDFANNQTIASDIQSMSPTAKVVKRGNGELSLSGGSYSFSGPGCLSVENGVLYVPVIQSPLDQNTACYPCLEAKAPGELRLSGTGKIYLRGISGDGTITSVAAMDSGSNFLDIMGDTQTNRYDFSGSIGDNVFIKLGDYRSAYSAFCPNQALTGAANGNFKGFYAYCGDIGVGTFGDGTSANPGSLGYGAIYTLYGTEYASEVGFSYDGAEGGTSARDFQFRGNSGPQTFYVDGGAYGGLNFSGTWQTSNTGSNSKMYRLCLRGEGAPCVFSGSLTPMKTGYDIVLAKQGGGRWNLVCGANNTLRGPVHVEQGTLGYDSVGAIGEACALGKATMLQTNFYDAAEAPVVPYAVKIGDGRQDATVSGLARLDYLGGNAVQMSVRPITLDGAGAFSGTAGVPMDWRGFAASPAGGTLVLDGAASDGGKIVRNLDDGEGVLSVDKQGEGTWTIAGTNTFTGKVRVRSGTLVALGDRAWYTWFRWTVKDMLETPPTDSPALQEIALYAINGVRQNVGLDYARTGSSPYSPTRKAADLPPGTVTYGTDGSYNPSRADRDLDCCFDDSITTKTVGWYLNSYPGLATSVRPDGTDAHVWQVVMHLTNAAPEIAQYDFCGANVFGSARRPGKWSWEGSHDGEEWDELVDYTFVPEEGASFGGYKWIGRRLKPSGGSTFEPGRVLSDTDTGFPLRGYSEAVGMRPLGYAVVQVDPGATLKANGDVTISRLAVDATTGSGTIDGFAFAALGEIDVVGVASSTSVYEFTVDVVGCTGFDSVADWSLKVNGERNRGRSLAYLGNGRFRMVPSGMVLIYR